MNFSDSMIEPRCLTGVFDSPALFPDSFASRRNGFVAQVNSSAANRSRLLSVGAHRRVPSH
jgi:hypothetical protein